MSWMPDADYLEPLGGLLREVMDAHGGFSAWHGAKAVRAVMSTGGLLFLMRTTRDAFHQTEVVVDLHSPRTEIRDFPRGGQNAFFTPRRVWIEDRDGRVLAERHDPRASFGGVRKQLHWDHLDSVYFAGYAVWNYITAPYLLCRSDVTIEEGASCVDRGPDLARPRRDVSGNRPDPQRQAGVLLRPAGAPSPPRLPRRSHRTVRGCGALLR